MKRQHFFFGVILIFIMELAFSILGQAWGKRGMQVLYADSGILDLTEWDQKNYSGCSLAGEWLNEEGEVVSLPQTLFQGAARYRTYRVYLRGLPREQMFNIRLSGLAFPYEVMFEEGRVDSGHPMDTAEKSDGWLTITLKGGNVVFMNTVPVLCNHATFVDDYVKTAVFNTVMLTIVVISSVLIVSILGKELPSWKKILIVLLWDLSFQLSQYTVDASVYYRKFVGWQIPWKFAQTCQYTGCLIALLLIGYLSQWLLGHRGGVRRKLERAGVLLYVQLALGVTAWLPRLPYKIALSVYLAQISINIGFSIWLMFWYGKARADQEKGICIVDAAFLMALVGELLHMLFQLGIVRYHSSSSATLGDILLYCFVVYCYYNQGKKLQNACRQSKELETLVNVKISKLHLAQIHPHFLYNSMSAIRYLISKDREKALEALDALTEYLRRYSHEIGNKELVSFEESMKLTDQYLYMEKLRFEDRLRVEKVLTCGDFLLPPLTVITLVENAVKHGLQDRVAGGILSIHSYEDDKNHYVEIADNGKGFDPAALEQTQGTGIANIACQLKIMVGGSLDVDSRIGQGTRVTVRVPRQKDRG